MENENVTEPGWLIGLGGTEVESLSMPCGVFRRRIEGARLTAGADTKGGCNVKIRGQRRPRGTNYSLPVPPDERQPTTWQDCVRAPGLPSRKTRPVSRPARGGQPGPARGREICVDRRPLSI